MRVGVTGHRWNRIKAESEGPRLAEILREAMAELPGSRHDTTLVTGMAEGTDLTAAMVRPAHWKLEAVLALPERLWRDHLATAPGVGPEDRANYDRLIRGTTVVVVGTASNKPDYVGVASYLACTCELIFTVWDGEIGPPGGTSDVVTRALNLSVPVVNLWPRLVALRQIE